MMYAHFLKYTQEKKLFSPGEKVLLAVSGGVDSMVMSHLFFRSGIQTGMAHCNFHLRGKESDDDEKFVKQWATAKGLPFFGVDFDTKQYAAAQGVSTQMAARTLRYAWFNELLDTQGYDKVAVAHHADDNVETVLLNLVRGTGLKGVCGIAPVNGRLIRPLLFATREQISRYAADNDIAYREDRSNASDDYARNYIRHHVTPELKTLNPSLAGTFRHNSEYLQQACCLLEETVKNNKAAWCVRRGDEWHIDINALRQTAAPGFWLFELLQDFGFNSTQIADVARALNEQSGKRFFSATHELVKDRDSLIICPKSETENAPNSHFYIQQTDTHLTEPIALTLEQQPCCHASGIPKDKHTVCLDAGKLRFPLTLRLWQKGDAFVPFGMKGKQKLSDFFIDHKIPLPHKRQQWVILSDKDIVWLVGQRPDDRYKVTPHTKNILQITWNANPAG
ncbi:MAG: tRNA lysidine(34) synthetase TilS [Prevotellaceae bacterium]|jgi:tRNA(Ile)-lysidine synthase|nr:tRNA lysidine(34) synthetase TilS [Prevotellaceae bacterium]